MNRYVAPVIAAATLVGCGSEKAVDPGLRSVDAVALTNTLTTEQTTTGPSPEPDVEHRVVSIGELRRSVQNQFISFTKEYGCTQKHVVVEEVPDKQLYNRLIGRSSSAQTVGNHILVTTTTLKDFGKSTILSLTEHELAHLCGGEEEKLEHPFFVNAHYGNIVATEGLAAKWDKPGPDGKKSEFDLIEEAYATLIQKRGRGLHERVFPPYVAVAELLEQDIKYQNITFDQLVEHHRNSDFFGFVAHVMGISDPSALTSTNVLTLMQRYAATYDKKR